MSDYFSLGRSPGPGDNSPRFESKEGEDGDAASVRSGDSYLMEMMPTHATLVDSQQQGPQGMHQIEYHHFPQGAPSSISGISAMGNMPLSATGRDNILPKNDPRSPYYINVPIPVGLPSDGVGSTSPSGTPTGEEENQFVREFPTDILMDRFYKWRKILKGLIIYLREVAYSQEQFARINFQLKNSVKFPFLTDIDDSSNKLFDPLSAKGPTKKQQPVTLAQKKQQQQQQNQVEGVPSRTESNLNVAEYTFQAVKTAETDDSSAASGFMKFGSGSIQDVQVILKKYHLSIANQQLKVSKEITSSIVPKMEDLRKDLQLKIKEIKDLHGDFKTNITEHVAITGQFLNKYIASVKFMNNSATDGTENIKLHKKNNQLKPKHDPYLLKLQLDLQLKRQLLEENYLQEAFINLQSSGMELEKIVYTRIQHTLQKYCLLIDSEARLMIKNLCRELQQGMLARPPALEWDHFVSHHPTCLVNWKSTDPIPIPRKLSDIFYPQMKSPLAKCIRAGYLTKKSKFLKNYNKGYFVLTSNYLHEFKSSNFFKTSASSPSESKDHQNVPIASQNTAKTSLIPIMSISLNDCILTEASENKFVLVGKPTFNDIDLTKPGPVMKGNVSSASASTTAHSFQEAPKKLTKSTLGKLLKGGKSKNAHSQKTEGSEEVQQFYAAAQKENDRTVNWVFKPASSNPSPDDIKQFKKWASDLKNLTTFNNTKERSKFIEERVLKTQTRIKGQFPKPCSSNASLNNMDEALDQNSVATSFRKERPGRPQYIQLQSSSSPNLDLSYRSRVNTPAVDDNGNLITVAERRFMPSALGLTSPAISSPQSLNSNSEGSSSRSSILNPTHSHPQHSQQAIDQNDGAGMAITSNGVTPVAAPVVSGTPVNYRRHQRNISQTHSLTGLPATATSMSALSSPKSVHSEGSMGGYFAIPVKNQNGGSQGSTPLYSDDTQGQQNPLSRTSSRGTTLGMRSTSGGYSPQLLGMMNQAPNSVPKFKLNDQDVLHHDQTQQQGDMIAQKLKKNAIQGAIPTAKSEGTLNTVNSPFYLRSNNSANSLSTNPSRTHPIRKHKKNVSFSSLNSLMFSKKATPGGTHMTDLFMSGGIQEDDDDGSQSLKLNQSIYS